MKKVRAFSILVLTGILTSIITFSACGKDENHNDSGVDFVIDLSGGSINKLPNETLITTYGYFIFPSWEETSIYKDTKVDGKMDREDFREHVILLVSESDGNGGVDIVKRDIYINDFDTYCEYRANEGKMYLIHKLISTDEKGKENVRYKLGDMIGE